MKINKILCIAVFTFAVLSFLLLGQGVSKAMANIISLKSLRFIISEAIPMVKQPSENNFSVQKFIFGFDINDPLTIINNQMLVVNAANYSQQEEEAEEKETISALPTPDATATAKTPQTVNKISEITIKPQEGGVSVKNNTKYEINPDEILNSKLNFNLSKKGPKVLIVQTHASESYTPSDKNYYLPTDRDRTEDRKYNVVRVGEEIANTIKGMGIEVIHDTKIHDYPSYNGSYKNSLATVEDYLKKYPSIKVVIDVHRDAMIQADKTKLKLCTDIEGKKTAQVMIVTGTDQGGLTHPNWRENLKFSVKLQNRINKMYKTLARPIDLRKERFNTHTTSASIIVEVGSNGNTLEEAINAGACFGKALGAMLKDIK